MDQAKQLESDIREIMSLPAGRRLVAHITRQSGMWRTVLKSQDVNEFFLGQRHTGLMLYNDVDSFCPELLDVMRREERNNLKKWQLEKENEDEYAV